LAKHNFAPTRDYNNMRARALRRSPDARRVLPQCTKRNEKKLRARIGIYIYIRHGRKARDEIYVHAQELYIYYIIIIMIMIMIMIIILYVYIGVRTYL